MNQRQLAELLARIAEQERRTDYRLDELEQRIAALEERKKPGPKPKNG